MPDTSTFDHIMEALQFDELPQEEQEAFLLELNELVFRGTMTRIVSSMGDAEKDAFLAYLETEPSDDDMEDYLAKHVPQADAAAEETIREITDDILSVIK